MIALKMTLIVLFFAAVFMMTVVFLAANLTLQFSLLLAVSSATMGLVGYILGSVSGDVNEK